MRARLHARTHAAQAISFLRAGCTCAIDARWPHVESDIFGCCAKEKGYDSVQFAPQAGQSPLGTFGGAHAPAHARTSICVRM